MNLSAYNLGIDFLKYQDELKLQHSGDKSKVWDLVRKKYIVLQPEEFVRQLVIQWLVQDLEVSKNLIHLERQFTLNNRIKRFDIIVYDRNAHPFLLIECKAPQEKLNQKVFDQIAVYHSVIQAPYLLLTNGLTTYLASIDSQLEQYTFETSVEKIYRRS